MLSIQEILKRMGMTQPVTPTKPTPTTGAYTYNQKSYATGTGPITMKPLAPITKYSNPFVNQINQQAQTQPKNVFTPLSQGIGNIQQTTLKTAQQLPKEITTTAKKIGSYIINMLAPVIPPTIQKIKAGESLVNAYLKSYKELNEIDKQQEAIVQQQIKDAEKKGVSQYQIAKIAVKSPSWQRAYSLVIGFSMPLAKIPAGMKVVDPLAAGKISGALPKIQDIVNNLKTKGVANSSIESLNSMLDSVMKTGVIDSNLESWILKTQPLKLAGANSQGIQIVGDAIRDIVKTGGLSTKVMQSLTQNSNIIQNFAKSIATKVGGIKPTPTEQPISPEKGIIPKELEPLAIEARKYGSAEEFNNELKRVIDKYNSARLGASEAQRGLRVISGGLTLKEDILHQAYLKGITEIGGYTKSKSFANQFTDFYTQATKGIKEVKPIPTIAPEAQKGVVEVQKAEISTLPTTVKKPQDSIKTVMNALAKAKIITPGQEYLYTKERGEKIAKAIEMGKKVKGEKGFIAQLGQLKGEMAKIQLESIRKDIGQDDIDNLFNLITDNPNISEWNKINAKAGLAKLLGEYGTSPLTRGEITLLKDIFGKDFTDTLLNKRTLWEKAKEAGIEIANIPRAVMASFDFSAPLRQGVFFIGRPKQFIPAFLKMFPQTFSTKSYEASQESITKLPSYKLMQEGGLQLTDMKGLLTQREEAFMSSWAEKIPLVGKIISASNRAYTGFLNKLRADVFDSLIKYASQVGRDPDTNPKLVRGIAEFVNAGTGRGNLGIFEKSAVWLNTALFSPRLVASRIELLNPVSYIKADPFVRKEMFKSLFSFLGIGLTILGLAKMNGAKVESDPRSADFGKIKIDNTRLDIWGGFQQVFRTVAQVVSGKIISTTTGREMILGEGYRPLTRADIMQRFIEYKTSPVFSFALGMLEGKTAIGEDFKVSKEVVLRFIPMVMQDMYDALKEYKDIQGLGLSLPTIFGVGSQTYKPKPLDELRMKIRDNEATTDDIKQAINNGLIKNDKQKIIDFITEAKLPNDVYSFKKKSAEAQVDFLEGMSKEDILKYLPYKKEGFVDALKAKKQEQQQDELIKPTIPEGKISEPGLIHKIVLYSTAIGVDPVTAFNRILTGQKIRRIDANAIIVERMPLSESETVKQKQGAVGDMILDHTIPLELGGSNSESNLKLVSSAVWKSYTPVENHLGDLLRQNKITKAKAQKLIQDFKNGRITAQQIINL